MSECQTVFLAALDRTMPIAESIHENQRYFWDLVGYFVGFFKKNNQITSVLFDNTPHMPWDICLFYVAKLLNKDTLIGRKTGISGYIYLDEDFRPGKSVWSFAYTALENPLLKYLGNAKELRERLNELSFTKGQVGGMWAPVQQRKNMLGVIRDFLKKAGLKKMGGKQLMALRRFVFSEVPNNSIGATEKTVQRSTLAGMKNVGKLKFLIIQNRYNKINKQCVGFDKTLTLDDAELSKPYIYFALHFQPERTTLPEGLVFDDQLLAIRITAAALPEGWRVIVKDHPRQYSYDLRSLHFRTSADYERITQISNVVMVPSNTDHKMLLDKSVLTATISGSVSWEGLLCGKPSLVFSEIWHAGCMCTRFVTSPDEVRSAISELSLKSVDDIDNDICLFVSNIMSSLINASLNINHLKRFFPKKNKSMENLSSAIIQRLTYN